MFFLKLASQAKSTFTWTAVSQEHSEASEAMSDELSSNTKNRVGDFCFNLVTLPWQTRIKITWILNIFAKHSCNEEMEKLGLQISEVSQEGKIWDWFGSIASFISFWQMPSPARRHVQCPSCHFTPEVSDFEPRITIHILTKCKIILFYIFNKKGFQRSAEFNKFNPINAKLKETHIYCIYSQEIHCFPLTLFWSSNNFIKMHSFAHSGLKECCMFRERLNLKKMQFHKLVAYIQLPDSFSEALKLLSSELVMQYFSGKTPIGPFCRCLQQKARKSWGTVTIISLYCFAAFFFLLFCQERLSRITKLSTT